MDDFRFSLRMLRKNRVTSSIAIGVLALGIGANTAVFSLVNAVLLRPLQGVKDPEQLVTLYRSQKADAFNNFGYPDYADYRDRNRSFSRLAAHCPTPLSFSDGTAERLRGDVVTGNYFEALGVNAAIGRLLRPEDDDGTGAHAVAVLSYGLWQRKFGRARDIIGTRIVLNGYPFNIVGVAQPEFNGPLTGDSFDLWVPLSTQRHGRTISHLSDGILEDRAAGWLGVFGRLKTGVSFQQAEAEMKIIAGQLSRAYPLTNAGRSVNLVRGLGLYPDRRAEVSGLLDLLLLAVALLLLIACANVAGLLMVRSSSRRREMAVRLAVGASRGRIIRQLLMEGVMLSLIGAALGLLLSKWAAQWMASLGTSTMAFRNLAVSIDVRVLGFTFLASLGTGLLFSLLPALQSVRVDLANALKNGAPGAAGQQPRLRAVLVVGQVAVSFVLLAVAGMLARSLYHLVTTNPGFETRNVAMASIDLTIQRYSEERGAAFYRELLDRLAAIPGVVSASLAWTVPPKDFGGRVSIFYPGQEPPPDVLHGRELDLGLRVDIDQIAPHYFRTLGIPLVRGRDFTDHDRAGAPGVVIVSQKLAQRLWPNANPIGKRISWPPWQGPPRAPFEVIGLAADIRYRSLTGEAPLLMYVPVLQNYDGRTTIVVRTASDPRQAVADIENTVKGIDKDLAVYGEETMSRHIAASLWQERMSASWIGGFSLLALVMAAVGLYGVIAQSVAQRTRELGIRVALGAAPTSVAALVVKEGMLLVFTGLALGAPATLALSAVLRGFLSGVNGQDPATFAAVALLLGALMVAACWVPARRAAGIDPVEALRCE